MEQKILQDSNSLQDMVLRCSNLQTHWLARRDLQALQ